MRYFLGWIAAVAVLFVGTQWWNSREPEADAPTMASPTVMSAPAANTNSKPPLPGQSKPPPPPNLAPPPRLKAQVRTVNPGVLSDLTPYAGQLNGIRQMLEQGDVSQAEARLTVIPQEATFDPVARQFIAGLWNNVGVAHANAHGMGAGIPAFKKAVALDGDSAAAHLNLVNAFWDQKDPAMDKGLLERTVALAPQEVMPHLALADVLYAKGDVGGSVAQLDEAAQHAGQHSQLQSFIKTLSARLKHDSGLEARRDGKTAESAAPVTR